jgi:hypothetical protein
VASKEVTPELVEQLPGELLANSQTVESRSSKLSWPLMSNWSRLRSVHTKAMPVPISCTWKPTP